jgi:trehalose 6-phosphate phosphatase
VPEAATLAELLAPLRADPSAAAVLLDVDGTLAPITRHAEDAAVPETTRTRLSEVARTYSLVACISGRRAAEARRIVSIGRLSYVGNHGIELLRPAAREAELDPSLRSWARRVQAFAHSADTPGLSRLRVRIEDKDAIVGFHWRGAPDEPAAEDAVRELAGRAQAAGLGIHWGRKVLEVRPAVPFDKGAGIEHLLGDAGVRTALYAGDDATDLDAFAALHRMAGDGRLDAAVRIGVRSDEGPAEIEAQADVMVDGTMGINQLLDALLP